MPNEPRAGGPTATRVARNVRVLRRARGLDLKDLSARLQALGQPISVAGLSKLELGSRRVDVDDLAALALALDVSPARLLLPAEAGPEGLDLTPLISVTARSAWEWATGGQPAHDHDLWRATAPVGLDMDRLDRWRRESQPHLPRDDFSLQDLRKHEQVLAKVASAAWAAEKDGVPPMAIASYLNFARTVRQTMRSIADNHPDNPKNAAHGSAG